MLSTIESEVFERCNIDLISITTLDDDSGLILLLLLVDLLTGVARGVVIARPGGVTKNDEGCRRTPSVALTVETAVTVVRVVLSVQAVVMCVD